MRIGLGAELGALASGSWRRRAAVRAQSPAPALAPAASLAPGEIVARSRSAHRRPLAAAAQRRESGRPGRLVLVAGQPGPQAAQPTAGEQRRAGHSRRAGPRERAFIRLFTPATG